MPQESIGFNAAMLANPQDEHLAMKGNPVHPQLVYKVIEVLGNPKSSMVIPAGSHCDNSKSFQ
jgi:hypothetical protein